MARDSTIEWTDSTWNPVTGCTQVSAGCDNCYAKTFAERWRGIPGHHYEQGFDLRLWPSRLELPKKWKQPRRIFVDSMSDLFHSGVPDEFVLDVWNTMLEADHHQYQILTKRPQRLARMAQNLTFPEHIWVGVSIEDSEVTWRADFLRKVPAAIRFISAEPLLGSLLTLDLTGIDWLITGGESGPRFRHCDPEWVRELRAKCADEGVAFFHKQWGGRNPKSGGRTLDGRTWDEFPVIEGRRDGE